MTFTEFLRATGKQGLAAAIDDFEWPPDEDTSIPPVVHEHLLEQLRAYQFVGGMPEAVKVYADSGNLRTASTVHASIVDTYRDDFPKYAPRRDMTRMLRVFNFAARQPSRKVKYSNVSPDDQSATILRDIDPLAMARVVAKVTHSACSGLPLQADLKESVFKLVFLDVGLMNAICGVGWETLAARTGTELVNAGTIRRAVHRPAPSVPARASPQPGTHLLAAGGPRQKTPRSTSSSNSVAGSCRWRSRRAGLARCGRYISSSTRNVRPSPFASTHCRPACSTSTLRSCRRASPDGSAIACCPCHSISLNVCRKSSRAPW